MGSAAWTRQFHYSDGSDDSDGEEATAVTVSGSNVYLVGDYDYLNDPNNSDIVIIKLTTSGGYVWERHLNLITHQVATDISFNGGLYVSSTEYTSGFSDSNGVVRKYSATGDLLWTKTQDSSGYNLSRAVLARTSSEVYVAGTTTGVLGDDNIRSGDGFLRRLNGSNGNTVWTD